MRHHNPLKNGYLDKIDCSNKNRPCLTNFHTIQVVRCCTGTLHNLSYLREGLESIQKYRGIPILCELLSNSSENVLYYTITTLHNMIQVLIKYWIEYIVQCTLYIVHCTLYIVHTLYIVYCI